FLDEQLEAGGWGYVALIVERFLLREEPRVERLPDVAVVQSDRLPPTSVPGPLRLAPDLAIEVRSPTDSVTELHRKLVDEYFEAGTQEAWVVDPDLHTITVLRPGVPSRSYDRSDVLESAAVPGLRISLEALFGILDANP